MAKSGDMYTITLKKSHIDWGTHRYTGSRGNIQGEGYLPIPRDAAVRLNIVNSNGTYGEDILGKNIFHCVSEDGSFRGRLRAQECNFAGDSIAKQFSADKELKALGSWYSRIGAQEGTIIEVRWTSETDIVLSVIGGTGQVSSSISRNTSVQSVVRGILSKNKEEPAVTPKMEPVPLNAGDLIRHKVFGTGEVTSINGTYFTAKFSAGEKKFSNPQSFETGFVKKQL